MHFLVCCTAQNSSVANGSVYLSIMAYNASCARPVRCIMASKRIAFFCHFAFVCMYVLSVNSTEIISFELELGEKLKHRVKYNNITNSLSYTYIGFCSCICCTIVVMLTVRP